MPNRSIARLGAQAAKSKKASAPCRVEQVTLDELQRAPRGRVIRVQHQVLTERRLDSLVDSDDLPAQPVQVDRAVGQPLHLATP
jgi:hypothetical protein